MKKIISIFAIMACVPCVSHASQLTDAIANVRDACGGISNEMSDMKTMAGINTAVTGVGTVAGGIALGTGIAKANVDSNIEEWEKILDELEAEQKASNVQFSIIDSDAVKKALKSYSLNNNSAASEVQNNIDELNEKSKSLGNWRTGTMATSSVANIAGTVIASNNRIRGDLQSQINNCIAVTKVLAQVRMQSRIDGIATDQELNYSQNIITKCGAWETVDLSKIDNRAKGATISSAIGATTGIAGTITSASANSDKVRSDNSDAGKQKEKNLNTASNILAGTTTAASATATIFNATQISAIKRAATVADECEGALK